MAVFPGVRTAFVAGHGFAGSVTHHSRKDVGFQCSDQVSNAATHNRFPASHLLYVLIIFVVIGNLLNCAAPVFSRLPFPC